MERNDLDFNFEEGDEMITPAEAEKLVPLVNAASVRRWVRQGQFKSAVRSPTGKIFISRKEFLSKFII